jgi:hypothetical protein
LPQTKPLRSWRALSGSMRGDASGTAAYDAVAFL